MVEPHLLYFLMTVIFGLCLGSFATALVYRLPRGESVFRSGGKATRSRCPSCGTTLKILDLVPFFSWLFSGGKCRYCKAPIGVRYPLIEGGTALLCVIFFLRFGMVWPVVALMVLAAVLVALIVIDLDFMILPDGLNLTIFWIAVAVMILGMKTDAFVLMDVLKPAAIGLISYGLFSYLLRAVFMVLMKKDPLGLGDVKFFAVAGFWLGIEAAPTFMIVSGLSGVLLSLLWRRKTGEAEFPFGPSIILAFVWCLLDTGGILLTPDPGFWRNFI